MWPVKRLLMIFTLQRDKGVFGLFCEIVDKKGYLPNKTLTNLMQRKFDFSIFNSNYNCNSPAGIIIIHNILIPTIKATQSYVQVICSKLANSRTSYKYLITLRYKN